MTDGTPRTPTALGHRHFDSAKVHGHERSDTEVGRFARTDVAITAMDALGGGNG